MVPQFLNILKDLLVKSEFGEIDGQAWCRKMTQWISQLAMCFEFFFLSWCEIWTDSSALSHPACFVTKSTYFGDSWLRLVVKSVALEQRNSNWPNPTVLASLVLCSDQVSWVVADAALGAAHIWRPIWKWPIRCHWRQGNSYSFALRPRKTVLHGLAALEHPSELSVTSVFMAKRGSSHQASLRT